MLGFFAKAAKREAIKLAYQNAGAVNSLASFRPDLCVGVSRLVLDIEMQWAPGEAMSNEHLKAMLNANRELRKAYGQSPMRFERSLDEAVRPMLGWRSYYADFGL